jgi:hypothetical protein
METVDKLSYESESLFFDVFQEATASSIFFVTVFSTSDGEAPGYMVATVITFCSNLGINS